MLLASGSISFEQVLDNATNTGVVTLLLLLMASAAVEKTPLLKKTARYLINQSYSSSYLRMYITTGIASAFLNNTAVVAALISTISTNPHHLASRLLIPLSYAAILGGMTTLIGTSTNLLVNSLLLAEGEHPLGFFDFSLLGLSVFFVCGTGLYLLSPLLPRYEEKINRVRAYFIEAQVSLDSPLCEKTVANNKLRNLGSLYLTQIDRNGRLISPVRPTETIQVRDKLIFAGDVKDIHDLDQFSGLTTFADNNGLQRYDLKEVVISERSMLVGKTLKMIGFRSLFDAAVVAIHRDAEQISGKFGNIVLRAGDNLILAIGPDFPTRRNLNKNFYFVSDINIPQRLSPTQETIAITGFIIAILVSIFALLSLFEAIFYYLVVLTLTNTLSASELKQRIPLDLWMIIVAALSLATALDQSGLLAGLGQWLNHYIKDFSPKYALVAVYFLTLIMTELITNNAAAALSFPIAYGIAQGLEVNITPFVMAIVFGANASFMSPHGYQTNLMVFNTGRYHLLDFVKIGLPVSLLYSVTILALLPILFPIKN